LLGLIIKIIILGTTAHFEPRPSSEASAIRPYFLQYSSNVSPPTSCHHPYIPQVNSQILSSFHSSSPFRQSGFCFFGFRNILFSGAGCQPCVQPPAILEDRLDCFLVWTFIMDQSGMGGPTSTYATASIAL
jgi:hypothetical protein